MPADLPTVIIEFDAAKPSPSTEFVLDATPLGSATGVLAGSPRWTTVVGVLDGSVQRGRTDLNGPVQAGTMTLTCDNAAGDFDPDNPYSVFNRAPANPYLVKGMAVRASAVWPSAGLVSPAVFYVGRLESIDPSDDMVPTATLTFVDDLAQAGSSPLPSSQLPTRVGESTRARALWLLSQLQLMLTPAVAAGLTRQLLGTVGGGQVLDGLEEVAGAEAGRLFADRLNRVTLTAHDAEYLKTTKAVFSDAGGAGAIQYSDPKRSTSRTQVVNAATVTRGTDESTPPAFAAAVDSINRYGRTSVEVSAPLYNNGDAQALATYLATRRATPQTTVSSLSVNFAGQPNAAVLLTCDLGDRSMLNRSLAYTTGRRTLMLANTIEGFKWSFSATNFDLEVSTAPVDAASLFGSAGAFRLNSSALGGADVLTPY